MKKRITALLLCLVMALSLIPTTVWAAGASTEDADDGISVQASNSTVVLHPSVNSTVTGVKVKVGDKIDGYSITSISGYDITVDLGKYNVNNGTFRLPYAKDIWEGVDDNKVDYISWAGSGSNKRSEGASALLANGKNTAYYYFKGAPVLLTFTLNYDANGGTGAPASQTYKATSQYEKSHTFTISSQTPTREGYTFLGWSTNKNATAASYQPGGSIVVTGTTTLYAVWEENIPPTPDKPAAPGEGDLSGLIGDITVNCTNDKASHNPKSKGYALISGSYTTSEVEGDAENGYTCTVTINSQKYVEKFDAETKVAHTPKDDSATVTLKYTDGAWTVTSGTPVIFNVVCETEIPDAPTAPGEGDLSGLIGEITVKCTNDTATHQPKTKGYALISGSYTTSEVKGDAENGYTCTVTINSQEYVEQFDADTGAAHDPKDATATVTLKHTDNGWTVDGGTPVIFNVVCETEIPDAPTVSDLPGVKIDCVNPKEKHADLTETVVDTTLRFGTVTPDGKGGYYCDVTITNTKHYVDQYNTKVAKDHSATTGGKLTVRLVWTPNANGVGGSWALETSGDQFVINVTCTTGGNTDPGTKPGTTPGTRRPYTKDEPKTVESGKTFDAGIAMYVGLSILSVTGSAVVIRKRKDF